MPTYSIEDAKARLAELIDKALAGEEVWIARDGAPAVELRARSPAEARRPSSRLIDAIAAQPKRRPRLGESAVDTIRHMREERTERILAAAASASSPPMFCRYVGVDYSGAKTPDQSLPGIRVFVAEADAARPTEVPPPPRPGKYWSRRALAAWLIERLSEDVPTLVGIDHGFSFPVRYFEKHRLPRDWDAFLDDFQRHWPTDDRSVQSVRDGLYGDGAERQGDSKWRRLTEERCSGAKSVFQFDMQGSVAKSTHAGIPWLRAVRQRLGENVHFWPFDGWDLPAGRSAIVEVYPALWKSDFAPDDLDGHQRDAYRVAAFLAKEDQERRLWTYLKADLTEKERSVASVEGWIFGVW
jgi:antitoxin (DNA-binding transcriptional repressor) of toxin-antitoxin stability system